MPSRLRALFESSEDDIERILTELSGAPESLAGVPPDEWLEALRKDGPPAALAAAATLASDHLPPPKITLDQCIELARREPPPVAELGLKLARMKPIMGGPQVLAVMALGGAAHPRVRQDGVQWAIQVIERSPHARVEHLRELLRAPYEDARRQAAAVMTRSLRFKDDVELWTMLARSPHEDARAFLLLHLTRRKPGLTPGSSRHLWATTMIALARVQGEVRRAVVERVLNHMAACPDEIEMFRPLLEIAGVPVPEPNAISVKT